MYRYEDQKEMRMAMNGKMIVMLAGVFLILTAVTSTLLQGMQYFIVGQVQEQEMRKQLSWWKVQVLALVSYTAWE